MNKSNYLNKFRQALLIKLKERNLDIWNRLIQLFPMPYELIQTLTAQGPIPDLIDSIFSEEGLCQENLAYLFPHLEKTDFFKQLIDRFVDLKRRRVRAADF